MAIAEDILLNIDCELKVMCLGGLDESYSMLNDQVWSVASALHSAARRSTADSPANHILS